MRIAVLVVALCCHGWAASTIGHNNNGRTSITGAGTALTLTSVPIGNYLMGMINWETSGRTLSSCAATGSTCVVDAGCHGSLAAAGAGDCFYILSVGSTTTSITLTASTTTTGDWYITDFSTDSGPMVKDSECTSQPASSATPATCNLTLSGTNDVLFSGLACANTCSGTPSGWTTPVCSSGDCVAEKLNTNSGTGATWAMSPAGTSVTMTLALKETGGGGGVVRRRAWVIQSP